jgi:hypothetical protein
MAPIMQREVIIRVSSGEHREGGSSGTQAVRFERPPQRDKAL